MEPPITGVLAGITPQRGRAAAVTQKLLDSEQAWQCWPRADVPARLHYGSNARIPPLVCLANEGWTTTTRAWLAKGNVVKRGAHGYDPELASMRATFIATGPAFARGRIVEPFENVDVYPMLARLLGLTPLPGDGSTDLFQKVSADRQHSALPKTDPS